MDKLHRALAIAGAVAMICIPIVGHSVYDGNAHVHLILAMLSTALGVVGFTAAKPLIAGDPTAWQRAHRALAIIGTMAASTLPMLSETYGGSHIAQLVIDLAGGLLGALGFAAVRPLGAGAAAAAARVLILVGFASAAIGCAPGTDGLRQACANIDQLLASSATTSTAIYRADQKALRARVTPDNVDAVAAVAASHDEAFDKLTDALEAASAGMATVCALPDAIDAGLKKDIPTLIASAIKIGGDVGVAVAAFKKVLSDVGFNDAWLQREQPALARAPASWPWPARYGLIRLSSTAVL